MRKPYEITDEAGKLVIRIDRDATDRAALERVLDYVSLEVVRRCSELTEDDAAALADEIDRAVRERVKHRYVGL